ncbi:MAG: carboxypeptidase regulatory-like domain-containing protein [Bacteroidales bacterium]|nr:carboxypeptidase regulatory-like domain-containing protein [Bacteroidales bacterium]
MKTKHFFRIAAMLALCCVMFGCGKDNKPGSIFGMVSDFSTNEPVQGANVQLRPSGETTLTGSDGMYEFTEVPVGEYSITVSKAEYTDLVDDYVIDVKEGKRMRRDVQIKKRPAALHLYDNESNEISELDFGADEGVTKKTFNIFNEGTRKIEYSIEKSVEWIISVNPPEGTINVGDNKPITVTINRRLLALGDNTTALLITSSVDGGKELTVKVRNNGAKPVVSILETNVIDSVTYRIRCEVESDGGVEVTERGICWNTFGTPTLDDETKPNSSGGTGEYTIRMEHLTMATHYYVRAYAKNQFGTGFSEVVDFVTGDVVTPPTVATVEVKDVTATSAVCKGNVTTDGGTDLLERGVCWGSTANPTVNEQHHAASSASVGEFSVSITGLTANTTYHVRAYAKNSKGTAYGRDLTFKTLAPNSYAINVSANPAEGGTVEGGGGYTQGQSCTVKAKAKAGYTFKKWTENGSQVSTDANYTFTVNGNRTLVAQFQPVSHTISTLSNPTGGGATSGGGSYQHGQQCTVTVTASMGYDFTEWTENGSSVSTSASYTFTVTGDRTLVANFIPKTYTITVSANPANGGNVSGGGTYSYGQSCTVTADPIANYHFVEWTENGSVILGEASHTFTVTGDRTLVACFSDAPVGALDRLFTINANGDQVYFSKGNLQYIGSANTWKFADHQWGYVGGSQNNGSQGTTRDLFGWGTSGYNHGAICYQPWSTSGSSSDYYAYGNFSYNLYDQNGRADWGYNAISNGGNTENSGWRTLTKDEWGYVFDIRTTTSGIRYAKANVAGVNGMILVPDDWSPSIYDLHSTNTANANFTVNTIDETMWNMSLASNGCVFLPAAGHRSGYSVDGVGAYGNYWSASYGNSGSAYYVYFNSSSLHPQYMPDMVVSAFNMHEGQEYTCGSMFYDDGGPQNSYQNNLNMILTIYPDTEGGNIKVTFQSFKMESGYDFLYIYDGVDTNAPQIGVYTGSSSPGTVTATNSLGALTFKCTSDGGVTSDGWSAFVQCDGYYRDSGFSVRLVRNAQ